MMLSFKLSMPNVGSWNGVWTGDSDKYYEIRSDRKQENELDGKYFYYNFGDGWGAGVTVEKIDSREAKKRKRITKGFCGYDWMVDEILKHGRILTLEERQKYLDKE